MILKDNKMLVWEIKRYLRFPIDKEDAEIDQEIFNAIEELKKKCEPKYNLMIFPIEIQEEENKIVIQNTNLVIQSKNLTKFLKNSKKVAVLAATIGIQADRLIKNAQYSNIMQSMIVDATASALVEVVCDYAENKLRADLSKENWELTSRFSPGYGDLEINLQPMILNLLDATKYLGISATDQFFLIPSKSVTAFMGIKVNEKINFTPVPDQPERMMSENKDYNLDLCIKCQHYKRYYYLQKGEYCEYRRTIKQNK